MKLIIALGALSILLALFVGCATVEIPPPVPDPSNSLHDQVVQADRQWIWWIGVGNPSQMDKDAVQAARDAYTEALNSGDPAEIQESGENYIGLVTEFTMPPL